MADIAYKRVSTEDQNLDRQLDGLSFDKIFADKLSGSTTKRPQLTECLDFLREGDTLHVHSIDRLSRSIQDLIMLVDKLNSNGVNLKFHKENLIFATGSTDANSAFQLHLFGIIAQYERAIIRERQREGIAIAQRKGKYLNRNCNTIGEDKRNNAIKLIGNSNLNAQEIADAVGVSRTTIINIKRELRNAKQESSGETL